MKKLIFALLITANVSANTATAWWTGKSRPGQSVTGRAVISCEYRYNSTLFWRTFEGFNCPNHIEVY